MSLCFSLISYTEQYIEYDPFVTSPEPSNPWTSDDPSLWDLEARYEPETHTELGFEQSLWFWKDIKATCAQMQSCPIIRIRERLYHISPIS